MCTVYKRGDVSRTGAVMYLVCHDQEGRHQQEERLRTRCSLSMRGTISMRGTVGKKWSMTKKGTMGKRCGVSMRSTMNKKGALKSSRKALFIVLMYCCSLMLKFLSWPCFR